MLYNYSWSFKGDGHQNRRGNLLGNFENVVERTLLAQSPRKNCTCVHEYVTVLIIHSKKLMASDWLKKEICSLPVHISQEQNSINNACIIQVYISMNSSKGQRLPMVIEGISKWSIEFHPKPSEESWRSLETLLNIKQTTLKISKCNLNPHLFLKSPKDCWRLLFRKTTPRFFDIIPMSLCSFVNLWKFTCPYLFQIALK